MFLAFCTLDHHLPLHTGKADSGRPLPLPQPLAPPPLPHSQGCSPALALTPSSSSILVLSNSSPILGDPDLGPSSYYYYLSSDIYIVYSYTLIYGIQFP